MQAIFEATRTSLALIFLFYASWSDYKTREVSNRVWVLFAPPAFALTLIELLLYEYSDLILYGACFGLTTTFAIILFYSGGFGGADAKALMCLALALPFYPNILFRPLFRISPISRSFFPITMFSNAAILVIVPVLWIISRNILWRWRTGRKLFEGNQQKESIGKRILVLITGYKVPMNKLKEKWHIYPLEDVEENTENGPKRKLLTIPKDEGRDATLDRLERAIKNGNIQDGVWASPGLPMLVLLTIGLLAALFLGDIAWTIVSTFLR